MQTKLNQTEAKAYTGCWLDGHKGQYIGEDIIIEAEGFGFKVPAEYQKDRKVEGEWHWELVDLAESWLNEHVAPEGWWFGTNESGDWGLWRVEED